MSMIALLVALLALLGLGGGASVPPAEPPTTTEAVPAPAPTALERASLTWSGGYVGQRPQTVVVDDPAGLARLQPLVPDPLPAQPTGETGCADCFEYVLVLAVGGASTTYAVDDANLPESLAPLVQALRGGR